MTNDENFGFLVIRATTARGAFPVADAQVYITSASQPQSGVIASGRTDSSGISEKFMLPAPPKANSESPNIPDPFAKYNIEIIADGYYPAENFEVPVFPDIVSVQTVELVPLLGGGAGE